MEWAPGGTEATAFRRSRGPSRPLSRLLRSQDEALEAGPRRLHTGRRTVGGNPAEPASPQTPKQQVGSSQCLPCRLLAEIKGSQLGPRRLHIGRRTDSGNPADSAIPQLPEQQMSPQPCSS